MSTSGPGRGSTATVFANVAIGKFRITEAKLRALFANRNQPLFDKLTKWLSDLDDPSILGTLAAVGGAGSGMSLADAGIGKQFSEQDQGLKTLVKLAALSLATHIYDLLTGATEGLDDDVKKRLDLRRRIEAFATGGKIDEGALDALLSGGVDPAHLASVLGEMKEDAVFGTDSIPGDSGGAGRAASLSSATG